MITPSTELEAVNTLLRAIGESPVSSLSGSVGVEVVTARATISEISKAVQTEGWLFNTEFGYPLTRDTSGEINLPSNALVVDVPRRAYPTIDPVIRGLKLYDRMNHTYKFDTDIEARVVFGLDFTELPESARHYITYRAARKFQDNSVGSTELHQFNERDEMYARARLIDEQTEDADLNFLKDSPDFVQLWRV